jgi:predicted dehydrogenase
MVIRVAIIGLSAAATGSGWAATAHLPYLRKSPYYKIVALCNSSLENAEAAIKAFDLPPETRAFGSPEELAEYPDVDFVVGNTRVDLHGKVLLPSLNKGKNVFSEWPLDANAAKAKVMLDAAGQSGSKTVVGLQGRANPAVQKVKQIIEEGRIGKVLSSTFYGVAHYGGAFATANVSYLIQREVGGNILTIQFGHSTSSVHRLRKLLF